MALLSDTSFKQLFAFPELAKELLCAAVDQPWTRSMPLAAFEHINASYVSTSGAQRHDDLVWRISRPANGDLYLLIEFQTRPDQRMAERMQSYTALLTEDLARQGKSQDLQILPIVLYSGRVGWHAKTAISTLSAGQLGLEQCKSQFSYLLVDRNTIRDKGNVVYKLLKLDQMSPRRDDPRILAKELNLWIVSQSNQQLAETMRIVVLDRLRMNFPDLPAPQGGGLEEVLDMFNQEQFKSYTDYLVFRASRREHIKGEWEGRRRGKQLGHKAGRQEGLQEGLQKGRQEVQEIVRLMLARSGFQLPGAANQRLEQADLATLKGWVKKLLADEVPPELKD
jgi:hypothetical protein